MSLVVSLIADSVIYNRRPQAASWTPLHIAVKPGVAPEVAKLIKLGAKVNETAPGEPGETVDRIDRRLTPLHVAAEEGQLEIAK